MLCHFSTNKNYRMKTLIILFLYFLSSLSIQAINKSKHIILITIDGMRPNLVTDPLSPTPYLKMMRQNGFFVKRVKGIGPTATYPSHTTIVTGAKPIHHQIYYNAPFAFNKESNVSYWYADSIKSVTIWQIAKENGLKTASLFWPVSTGSKFIDYNVPEFWSTDRVANQMDFLKSYCTPKGLLEELESEATGKLNNLTFEAGTIQRDARTAYMANYILNKYKPNLLTVHLITTDYAQHDAGLKSDRVDMAIASADNAVGLILENLRKTGMMDSTTVLVCGDHGFSDVYQRLAPNTWLVQEKLLSEKPNGEWKAYFQKGGSTAFLYLKDKNDKKTLELIRNKIVSLPVSTRNLFRIVEKDELTKIGCSPDVVLAVEPIKGVDISATRVGEDVIVNRAGNHGYLSGYDPTALIIYGQGALNGETETISQTDIAPYIMFLLGIDHSFVDGILPTALIK